MPELETSDDNESNYRPNCRICFASNQTLMIPAPCDCVGTVGHVHKNCLRTWMRSVRNFSDCEICHGKYEKSDVIPKRSFEKLFKTFFKRPFYALCKFSGSLFFTAAVGYFLSRRMVPIFMYLDDVSENPPVLTPNIFLPLSEVVPFILAYGYCIESTALSFRDLLFALHDWWNFNSISFQTSDESIEVRSNLSSPDSDADFVISPIA